MKFSEYELELRLAFSQHPKDNREEEIYSLILSIMRNVYCEKIYDEKVFSIRDIHQSPPVRRDVLYGKSGYPDLAIYSQKLKDDTDWGDLENILGVVEAKAIGGTYKRDSEHILGEIDHYKKVLYTNGILWVYYNKKEKPVKSLEDDYIWRINLLAEEDSNEYAELSKKDIVAFPKLSYVKWRKLKKYLRDCIDWEK